MYRIFAAIGLLAIASGGLIAAFSARRPTRFALWLIAYLVLVEGLVQFGLASGWQRLGLSGSWLLVVFLLYNIGNAAVTIGRALKGRSHWVLAVVNLGGALLAAAMLLLIWTTRHAAASWTLVWFLALAAVILVSMPIGLTMSARQK